ncbi:MAG: polyhydroxyalkanoate synthesis protein PhaF [Actinomycetota bacterium]|nr:polyhydroxyalkanoate synthesis protein PhaF [Actinomycetota bacterium]
MFEDLRGYLQLASGLTEVTASKAKEIAMGLVSQGMNLSAKAPDVVGQVQELADDLVSTGKENREMLLGLIRAEVDRAVGRMGFVREDEIAALRLHVQRLEQQLFDLKSGLSVSEPAAPASVTEPGAPTDIPVKKIKKKKKVVVVNEGGKGV